ncbi:C40 family peptidase [Streptomyces sp. NBC_00390]|uniref:C40 family peptidase n=1 Tax=Streptomyces sp. NBC_00390 TaxID=2975736 RepID=UPI002E1D1406
MTAQMDLALLVSRARAVSVLTLAALGGTLIAPGGVTPAHAVTTHATKALQVAASKKGSPYRYGAAGPNRFDCSGLTLYSYKRAGKRLPRTAHQQFNRTHRISARNRQRGDLVFFHYGGFVFHVGIYAGKGRLWHSPKTGSVVRLDRIWTKQVWYGRVR